MLGAVLLAFAAADALRRLPVGAGQALIPGPGPRGLKAADVIEH